MASTKARIQQLLKRPFYRYLIIGGSVYVFELGVIFVAQAAGAGPVSAVALSFILGTTVSFLLTKFVTFGDKRTHRRIVISQALATGGLVVFNFFFTLLLVRLLTNHMPAVVSRTLALGITTIWNFYLYKTKIFNTNDVVEPIVD